MRFLRTIFLISRALITSRSAIAAENLALRNQLGVLRRSVKRPRLRQRDRILWVWLSQHWANWRSCPMIVQPDTVLRWHRDGFRLYWRWKLCSKPVHIVAFSLVPSGEPGTRLCTAQVLANIFFAYTGEPWVTA